MADDAGALLVRSGLVTASALDEARARVESVGGTLGEQLVTAGAVGDDVLTDFYKTRLLVPQVNPNTLARLATKVIATIPHDMAIELRVIPVSIDKDNNLTVAMSDPSDRHAVDEIGFFTGAYVVRAVATQMQIAWCLAHYYGHVTVLGQKLLQPTVSQPAVSPAAQAAVGLRSHTVASGQSSAIRHHTAAPRVEGPSARPSGEIEEITTVGAPIHTEGDHEGDAIPFDQPRASSISGELRVPPRRAESIRPLPEADLERELDDLDADTDAVIVTSIVPDLSEPTISIEAGEPDDDPTSQTRPAPARKRKAKTDPPELAARAGEIGLKTGPVKTVPVEESSIVIDDEVLRPTSATGRVKVEQLPDVSGELRVPELRDQVVTSGITVQITDEVSAAVVIHDSYSGESQPIMLDRKRETSDAPTNVVSPLVLVDQEDEDVVVLEAKKPRASTPPPTPRRRDRRTQVGVGALTAATRAKQHGGGIPSDIDDQPTGARATRVDNDPTRVDTPAAPLPEDYTPSDGGIAAPPVAGEEDDDALAPAPVAGAPLPSGQIRLDGVVQRTASAMDDDDEDDRGPATSVMSAVELDDVIPGRKAEVVPAHLTQPRVDYDPVDDGWGPPGTTIPPRSSERFPAASRRRTA